MTRIHTVFAKQIKAKEIEVIRLPSLAKHAREDIRQNCILRATAVPQLGFWLHCNGTVGSRGRLHPQGRFGFDDEFSFVCGCCWWQRTNRDQTRAQRRRIEVRTETFRAILAFECEEAGITHLVFRKGHELNHRVEGVEASRFDFRMEGYFKRDSSFPKESDQILRKYFSVW
jgi:hypothetical protein